LAIASEIYSPMHELDNHDSTQTGRRLVRGNRWQRNPRTSCEVASPGLL